jgi:hypothetical protein
MVDAVVQVLQVMAELDPFGTAALQPAIIR